MHIPPNPLPGAVFHMMCSFDSEWRLLIIASPTNSRLHTHDVESSSRLCTDLSADPDNEPFLMSLTEDNTRLSVKNTIPRRGCAMNISRLIFALLIAIAVGATVGSAHAQALIGSPGAAGWQSWSVDDILCGEENSGSALDGCIPYIDVYNGTVGPGTPAPYWNTEFGSSRPNDEGYPSEKNVGFCLTSTGDCQGIGSALVAPGPLKFWAMTAFTPGNGFIGTGGARDNKMYFKNSGRFTSTGFRWNSYRATLILQNSAVPCGVNAFGWFETNSTGTVVGAMHELF